MYLFDGLQILGRNDTPGPSFSSGLFEEMADDSQDKRLYLSLPTNISSTNQVDCTSCCSCNICDDASLIVLEDQVLHTEPCARTPA